MNVSQFLIQQTVLGENNGQLSKLLSNVAVSTNEVIAFREGLWVVLLLFPVIAWAYFSIVPLNLGKFVKFVRRLKTLESRSSNLKNDIKVRQFQGFKTDLILQNKRFPDALNHFKEVKEVPFS